MTVLGLTAAQGCADVVCGGGVGVMLAVALHDATRAILAVVNCDGGPDFCPGRPYVGTSIFRIGRSFGRGSIWQCDGKTFSVSGHL